MLVIDVDWRFDATRLLEQAALLHDHDHGGGAGSAEEALRHVHVVRPARGSPLRTHVAAVVAEARAHMVYGEHGSRARGFWGTVVVGGERDPGTGGGRGDGAAVEVTAGWRGWCTVEREPVAGFGIREGGMSAAEALDERERRQQLVDEARWLVRSPWGGMVFGRGGER